MQLILIAALGLVPAADAEPDAEVRKLQTELVKVLRESIAQRMRAYAAGGGTLAGLNDLSKRLRDAELALATKPAERVAAHLAYYKAAVEVEERTEKMIKVGAASTAEGLAARATRLEAEIALRKAGGKPPKGKE